MSSSFLAPESACSRDRQIPDQLSVHCSTMEDKTTTIITGQNAFFGVYDGHGGSACSEYLRRNLHVNIAANLYKDNYHEKMKDILIKVLFRLRVVPFRMFLIMSRKYPALDAV